jgi:hypothetical protein
MRPVDNKPVLPYIDTKTFVKKNSKTQIRKVVRKRSISLIRNSSKASIKSSYRDADKIRTRRASHRSSKSFHPRGSKSLSQNSREVLPRKIPKMDQEKVAIINAATASRKDSTNSRSRGSAVRGLSNADIEFDREISDEINQESNPNLTSRKGSENIKPTERSNHSVNSDKQSKIIQEITKQTTNRSQKSKLSK